MANMYSLVSKKSTVDPLKSLNFPGHEGMRQNPEMLEPLEGNCPTEFEGLPPMVLRDVTASSEATDPTDRLFALLSLTNDLSVEELDFLTP
jgi:hypothetical protein